MCQDELALRVEQLKAELVLFKGLMSNVSAIHKHAHTCSLIYLVFFCFHSAACSFKSHLFALR